MEVNDITKREAILKATGFNVTKAIEINKASQEEEATEEKVRRATPINASKEVTAAAPTRRTTPKYNVVKKID